MELMTALVAPKYSFTAFGQLSTSHYGFNLNLQRACQIVGGMNTKRVTPREHFFAEVVVTSDCI